MDLEKLRQGLRDDFKGGPFPDPIPLDLKVISKRTFHDYEEWKIEYEVETADTMPAEAGLRVPAYLLVPTREHDGPLPARYGILSHFRRPTRTCDICAGDSR